MLVHYEPAVQAKFLEPNEELVGNSHYSYKTVWVPEVPLGISHRRGGESVLFHTGYGSPGIIPPP